MESTENIWQSHFAIDAQNGAVARKTLNEDPYNVLAEDLALEECMQGRDVRQRLMETQLVTTSCGSIVEGTPDGGFVDADGLLTLLQVVRVPLSNGMSADEVADVLYDTVLTKIVKSQAWMKQTQMLPHEFIIFCWLPQTGAYQGCLQPSEVLLWTEALMWNVRDGGWPFSLRVQVPSDPESIFPQMFGKNYERQHKKSVLGGLSYCLAVSDFEEDHDPMQWYLFEDDNSDCIGAEVVGQETQTAALILIQQAIRMIEDSFDQHGQGTSTNLRDFLNGSEDKDKREYLYGVPAMFHVAYAWDESFDCAKPPIHAKPKKSRIGEGLPWWQKLGKLEDRFTSCDVPRVKIDLEKQQTPRHPHTTSHFVNLASDSNSVPQEASVIRGVDPVFSRFHKALLTYHEFYEHVCNHLN